MLSSKIDTVNHETMIECWIVGGGGKIGAKGQLAGLGRLGDPNRTFGDIRIVALPRERRCTTNCMLRWGAWQLLQGLALLPYAVPPIQCFGLV